MHDENLQASSLKSSKEPILSLILCARNDQYQGNSTWRLETALNYVAQNAAALDSAEDIEVIVADWGSKEPLRNVVKLSPVAAKIVSFVHIPPEIAKSEQKDSPFAEVLALNAAARRAKGEYIGRIDQDTLVGKHFLEKFFWLHKKRRLLVPLDKAVMLSNRRRIPYRFAVFCPSFWVVDRYLRWFKHFLPLMEPRPPHLYYQNYIGILLFHRDLWAACGGYDQRFIYMDYMEFDIILRLTKEYTFVNLGELVDHDFYHLDHGNPREPWSANRNRKTNPIRSLDNLPETINPTGDKWGLTQYPLEVQPAFNVVAKSFIQKPAWLTFFLLVFISGLQIVLDGVIIKTRKLTPLFQRIWWMFFAASTWKNRTKNVQERVTGQPLISWPRLLIARRTKEQVRRSEQS